MFENIIDMLDNARSIIEEATDELAETQPVVHKDLIEFRWKSIMDEQPEKNQKVIVKTKDGCMYFLSYPYDHTKHPYWFPIPNEEKEDIW